MVAEDPKKSLKLMEKEMEVTKEKKMKKYKYVAPDGGWGYLVAISTIISFSTTTAFFGTFGMMYDEFINEISMSSAGVTLVTGILCISGALSGFFTSALLKLMSMRWLAFAASVMFAFGTLGTVIMTSTFMFYITVGICQGVGFGIMFNLSCTVMNDYFVEKRVLIMSFVQTATGINAMVAPIFVKWSLEQYGSKGTLLLIGGLSLHNFVAVLLMQPVQWHMRKVEVPESTELKLLLEVNNDVKKLDTPVITLTDAEGSPTKEELAKAFESEEKSCFRKVVEIFIDTSLIKPFLLSCVALGPAMCNTADGLYIVMVPKYFYSMGWSQDNVAMAITLYGFGDLSMRVIFTIVSKWIYKLGIRNIYIVGIVLAVLSRIGMLWSSTVLTTMVYFTLMGAAHCSIAVLVPLVVAETVAPKKFTAAMGICLLLSGTFSFGIGPIIGAIRDFTNSYSSAFYSLISLYALFAVLWPIEIIVKNRKLRRIAVKNCESSHLNKQF
ncbi:hypothetical protein PYW07_007411 [Mythimna separata]|uniref:Major facilitator superfamily (MFS) profile domain-containing protein n=1 Tax=Mythimna separata TaxID=271217 RepID=A0AAD8E1D9_MYTSE|nr:hypothetical protein PYW07_007411 [Mythimna separata]